MAPKVDVLILKCAFSLKNSKLCFLGCIGYFSALDSPYILIFSTKISTSCPLPRLNTSLPFIERLVPEVIFFIIDSSKFSKSITH